MAKILLDKNNVVIAWQIVGGGWSDTENTIVEVEEIPEEVMETPTKYCYVNSEFILNPNYKPPEKPIDEMALLKAQIEAQSEQMDFYEDCIAEMAEIVYA